MKKTLLTFLTALLVLSLVTCSSSGEDEPVNKDVKPTVTLTIDIDELGASHALNVANARTASNYYEVIFHTPEGKWVKKTFGSGASDTQRSIIIPIGDYTGVAGGDIIGSGPDQAGAVMFAGTQVAGKNILLAVGTIASVYDVDTTTANDADIKATSKKVTFRLTALTNDVNDTPSGLNASTFLITGPSASVGDRVRDYRTASTPNNPKIGTTVDAPNYPVFPVPGVVDGVGYGNPNTTAGDVAATYSVTIPHEDAVIYKSPGVSVTAASIVVGDEVGIDGSVSVNVTTTNTTGSPLAAASVFNFKIDLGGCTANGLCGLSIEVPVCMYSSASGTGAPSGETWYIRGGSDPSSPDGVGGQGAIVLLAVGTHSHFGDEAEIAINVPGNSDFQ